MLIVGAGMAGCLAGVLNPQAEIIEKSISFNKTHDAVLRFRNDSISKYIGIPFKQVTVHKSIWYKNKNCQPIINLANMYSHKVSGRYSDHSIWNLAEAIRYIAPPDFHYLLSELCSQRITYNTEFIPSTYNYVDEVLSTIPMDKLFDIISHRLPEGIKYSVPTFDYKKIIVNRFKLLDSDIYQTIYYPDENIAVYRATITGDDLIVESTDTLTVEDYANIRTSFGLMELGETVVQNHIQKYGKINPINEEWRKNFMYHLTKEFKIYSLGRFATWRNILLDDVFVDIFNIRKMIVMNDYDIARNVYES